MTPSPAAMYIQVVGPMVFSLIAAVACLWNRATIAELKTAIAELRAELLKDTEARCEKCRERFISREDIRTARWLHATGGAD